jgi:ribonuclease R
VHYISIIRNDETHLKKDPFANREKERYAKPIASRELIIQELTTLGRPCTLAELAQHLRIEQAGQDPLRRRVRAMIRDGQLFQNRQDQLMLVKEMALKKARVEMRKNAVAWLHILDAEEGAPEVVLSPLQVREVMHNDIVLIRMTSKVEDGKKLAVLVDVVERGVDELVGCLSIDDGFVTIMPVNRLYRGSILVKKSGIRVQDGAYVLAKIIRYPSKHKEMVVEVVKKLGDHQKAGFERLLAVRSFNLPDGFSPETLAEADALQKKGVGQAEPGRQDFTHLPFVTIDGEDARDFDDAVYVEKKADGWSLTVAIADVAHYVTKGSGLDKEAEHRATSVYLPGSVIPMLPEALSCDLCSLVPDQNRFVLAITMHILASGKVAAATITKAVIRSHARMTYNQVSEYIEKQQPVPSWFSEPFTQLMACYEVLLKQRSLRGSIDFDFPETKLLFNQQGRIASITQTERNTAHKVIEECMLVANEQVAKFLLENNLPGLFRVHLPPDPQKVDSLRKQLKDFQVDFPEKQEYVPKDFQNFMKKIQHKHKHDNLDRLVLTTMSQAYYGPKNEGHFGLAYRQYCHFTSPIRRYPDLFVHRVLTAYLSKQEVATETFAKQLAKHCSACERRADEASRYIVNWLKCDYMADKIGKVYSGTISAVKGFGIFVTLDDFFVDGLVHVTQLAQDYYDFNADSHTLVGRKGSKEYRAGQKIKVKILKVDQVENMIDFSEVS